VRAVSRRRRAGPLARAVGKALFTFHHVFSFSRSKKVFVVPHSTHTRFATPLLTASIGPRPCDQSDTPRECVQPYAGNMGMRYRQGQVPGEGIDAKKAGGGCLLSNIIYSSLSSSLPPSSLSPASKDTTLGRLCFFSKPGSLRLNFLRVETCYGPVQVSGRVPASPCTEAFEWWSKAASAGCI
jgi:hypothetical protein